MSLLTKLHEEQSTWYKYAYSFGCDKSEADDLIQDMYIKVYEYVEKHKNSIMYNKESVNLFFVYKVMRSLFIDEKRKPIKNVEITFDIEDEPYEEDKSVLKLDAVNKWYSDKIGTDAENEYFKIIFDEVFIKGKKISVLARETNITYWSLRNAVSIIKEQINDLEKNI